jgi:hypothetical protein
MIAILVCPPLSFQLQKNTCFCFVSQQFSYQVIRNLFSAGPDIRTSFNNLQTEPYFLLFYIFIALPELASHFCLIFNSPIAVAERSRARTVFARSNTAIVGSNPT